MLTMTIPPATPQTEQIVLAQANRKQVRQEFDYVLKACKEVEQEGKDRAGALNMLEPSSNLSWGIRQSLHDTKVSPEVIEPTIKLLQGAQKGKLLRIEYVKQEILDKAGNRSESYIFRGDDGSVPIVPPDTNEIRYFKETSEVYYYKPEPGYYGMDQAVFSAEYKGKRYKIVLDILVQNMIAQSDAPSPCPEEVLTKVRKGSNGSGYGDYFYRYAGIEFNVDSLPGSIVAQTTGEGASAAITLDTNAAGYNWFVDATPADNAEFLPTSNPKQWIAKAGTEAASKMDLLSVLLHEYGHVLGIEHSTDSGDFMATTLQPGVRRLPSSDELALMAQLVGEIKPALSLSNGAAQGNTPDTPLNPGLPVGTTLSALLLGRLRRTGYGSWSPVFDSAQVPAPVPQFAIAANAKLENPAFDGGTGWTTEGAVAFANGSSSGLGAGAATLTETAASQTRLNQVFVLGEHDRFLSFTLANVALGDQAGPDDAFEVALLDANTGLSLLGGTGLSHNDAFLNIQANSLEHKASGITRIDNADGSRTYLVDLAGIAAGTTVNLAFDLIGFGQGAEASNSHITVRDLRLGVPQTADDSAMLAEDTPAIIDALTNDLNARQPGFVPVVVSGPAHGQVVVNADPSTGSGQVTFTYTPEKDWYGQDTFTYKLSDGRVDSNLATVNLTVTPVNDAPTAGDQQLVAIEDTQFTGSLLAAAADIDNVQLTGSIVAGPQHGQVIVAADGSFTYTPDQ
ncbi:MAG: Ig-like domain-containing protein [Sulfurimicrobium sp.]|nr:Ig-like domain-containing protein [Sulfurimicrobium sp.]